MGAENRKSVGLVIGVVAVALVTITALNWQWVALSFAILTAEKRPALLQDAKWNDEGSAKAFRARFHPGAPESDLTSWLQANKFSTTATGEATRRISSLPCSETIEVRWSASPDRHLADAAARVSEGGCL